MSGQTPYSTLPDHCYWSRAHRVAAPSDVDPVISAGFKVTRKMKISTAGSCFAQHIARRLKADGFTFYAPEKAHPVLPASIAARYGYGVFSARYGNIYTTRQLRQLAERALGGAAPVEDVWVEENGTLIDPYRPQVQPGGFATRAEFDAARAQLHLAFRKILRQSDVFVFTFGLTEAWVSKEDGAVFPVCPGAAGGVFDADKYEFKNFTVEEIVEDFNAFMAIIKRENPDVKVLMTVSPVPLIATAQADKSVITATAYSKAVLRVAVEQLSAQHKDAFYFPSYEVITGPSARGAYFGPDLREVTPEGVDHVMSLFMRHYAGEAAAPRRASAAAPPAGSLVGEVEAALDVICDEEVLDRPAPPRGKAGFAKRSAASRVIGAAAQSVVARGAVGSPPVLGAGKEASADQVVGLYSFPKSGNTWLRAIIAEICAIPSSGGALQKYVTDTHFGKALENPWPFQGKNWYFYKSHHKAPLTEDQGVPMRTDKIISIYRHPLDVFLSYLNFVSRNVSPRAGASLPVQFDKVEDLTPDEMEMLFKIWLRSATLFPRNRKFGNVFEAVAGFRRLQNRGEAVHIIRYEDLKDDFAGTVAPMVDFLGLEGIDLDQVFKGADTRTQQNGKFFWKRAKKNYEKYLTEDQIGRFETKYAKELKTLGY